MSESLEALKRSSALQLLFKCARLANDEAIAHARRTLNAPGLRVAHTALFPHIDLDGTRVTELAARLEVSKQAVGQLVNELEAMGLIERRPDPRDGRAKLVYFAGGAAGIEQGMNALVQVERDLADAIGADRHAALVDALQALEAVLLERVAAKAE